MSSSRDLLAALAGRVLVADGAMGTMLQAEGLQPGTPSVLWNVERPEAILAVHAAYVDAGAEVLLANSFGANSIMLERHDLTGRDEELNRAAIQIAREAAGPTRFVLGDIASTGELLAPLGTLEFDRARDVFAVQSRALAEAGADAILIETMMDPEEARAAIQGARLATTLPIICSHSFGPGGRTLMGATPEKVAELWSEGLSLIGANCGHDLDSNLAVIQRIGAALPGVPLLAKPNAGVPALAADGTTRYDVGPEAMAAYVDRFLAAGVAILGGCCGSTPAHIAEISRVVAQHNARGGTHA